MGGAWSHQRSYNHIVIVYYSVLAPVVVVQNHLPSYDYSSVLLQLLLVIGNLDYDFSS